MLPRFHPELTTMLPMKAAHYVYICWFRNNHLTGLFCDLLYGMTAANEKNPSTLILIPLNQLKTLCRPQLITKTQQKLCYTVGKSLMDALICLRSTWLRTHVFITHHTQRWDCLLFSSPLFSSLVLGHTWVSHWFPFWVKASSFTLFVEKTS